MLRARSDALLADVVVSIAAYVPKPYVEAPPHLAAVLGCIASWRALAAIRTLSLTIHTNNDAVIAQLLARRPGFSTPPNWKVRIAALDLGALLRYPTRCYGMYATNVFHHAY